MRDGVLTGREELVDEAFTNAYAWLRSAAARRGLGDAWPVWLWARTTRRALVGQAQQAARHEPGSVLITARILRSRLLLSDFDAWNCVLNHGPVFHRDATDADVDTYFEHLEAHAPGWHRPDTASAYARAELERTWEQIFDLSRWRGSTCWQATVAELRRTDVVDAVIIAPGRRRRRRAEHSLI